MAFNALRLSFGLKSDPNAFWRGIKRTFFKGRGAFVPKSPAKIFSVLFYGFAPGTFMVRTASRHTSSRVGFELRRHLTDASPALLPATSENGAH